MISIWFKNISYKLREGYTIGGLKQYCWTHGIKYSALYIDNDIPESVHYLRWHLEDVLKDVGISK